MKLRMIALAVVAVGAVVAPASAQVVSDGGFDTQANSVGDYCYSNGCPGGAWSISGNAGFIKQGDAAWPAQAPVSPAAFAFLQGNNCVLQQTVTVPATGQYVVNYWLASRAAAGSWGGNQSVTVTLAGQTVAQNTLTSGAPFTHYVSVPVTLNAGTAYTLSLIGGSNTGDNTAFVDSVSIVSAQSTTSYQYDALGRLTNVAHTGGVSDGSTSAYSLDPAGNRTGVVTTAPH